MSAHMSHMMGWGWPTWVAFSLFLLLLIAGAVVGGVALLRGNRGGGASRILAERLARGEITPEEYRARAEVLGSGGGEGTPVASRVGLALLTVGLVGALIVAAVGPGSGGGFMHGMMGGMGGMMGSGETGRSAPDPAAGAAELRVVGTEFAFDPGDIELQAGETINLVFDNRGHMFHTLTVGELGFELRANGGDTITGALRVENPGSYSFICAVPGHAEAGMRGTLTVT